jgi:hypothetical protein
MGELRRPKTEDRRETTGRMGRAITRSPPDRTGRIHEEDTELHEVIIN